MRTLPLPPRPDVEQYRKRAKGLVKASRSQNRGAVRAWASEWLAALARARGTSDALFVQETFQRSVDALEARIREKMAADNGLALADAQFLIARAHGFDSWSEFAHVVEWISQGPGSVAHADFHQDGDVQVFETAADAVVAGDLPALEGLLGAEPDLIRARSSRAHRATLLHYVAANGVEDFRQKTPPNAEAVARFLLGAGAEVDGLANTYSGGKAQTTMNLLVSSAHPADAGLQETLVETLLDFGAAIDGLEDDASPLMTALAFGYGAAAEALARRGARIDNIVAAAALGRLDPVQRLFTHGDAIEPSLAALYWIPVSRDPKARRELALVWASLWGHTAVVEFLLQQGVDPAAKDRNDMTALHCAAAHRYLDVVKLLLRHGAPLEARNAWGGTVLDSTAWFVVHGVGGTQPTRQPDSAPPATYAEVFETLIAAGADPGVARYRTGNRDVDEVLKRHGAGTGG